MKYNSEMDAFLHKHTRETRQNLTEMFNFEFGLKLNINQIKSRCLRIGAKTGRTGRLIKGHNTWNKGLKGYMPSPETLWKKGNVPATSLPVGSERLTKDGYIEHKFDGEPRLKLKHRYIWEKEHGPVPKNHALVFRNGDITDCRIENLILVSRAELLAMNKRFKQLNTPETRETVALLAKVYVKTLNLGKSL